MLRNALQCKAAGKVSALKWNTGWSVRASSLHHATTIKCQKYLGATEAYTLFIQRDALSNTGNNRGTRQKMKEVGVLWKKAQGDKISWNMLAKVMGRKRGHRTWWGSWLWAMVSSCFEPLMLSKNHTQRGVLRCTPWQRPTDTSGLLDDQWGLSWSTRTLPLTPLGPGRSPSYGFRLQLLICYSLLFVLW